MNDSIGARGLMKHLPMSKRARVEVLASNPAQYRAWAPGPPYWQGERRRSLIVARADAALYNERKEEELNAEASKT